MYHFCNDISCHDLHRSPFSCRVHSWGGGCVSCESCVVSWDGPGHNSSFPHHLCDNTPFIKYLYHREKKTTEYQQHYQITMICLVQIHNYKCLLSMCLLCIYIYYNKASHFWDHLKKYIFDSRQNRHCLQRSQQWLLPFSQSFWPLKDCSASAFFQVLAYWETTRHTILGRKSCMNTDEFILTHVCLGLHTEMKILVCKL